jgi:hypothetical protein
VAPFGHFQGVVRESERYYIICMTTMTKDPAKYTVPLSVAAKRLRWSWAKTFNAVLTGILDAERIEGRWFVAEDSIKRLERKSS